MNWVIGGKVQALLPYHQLSLLMLWNNTGDIIFGFTLLQAKYVHQWQKCIGEPEDFVDCYLVFDSLVVGIWL